MIQSPASDSVRKLSVADPYRGRMRLTGLFSSVGAAILAVLALVVAGSGPAAADTDFGLDPVVESALGGSSIVGVRVGQGDGFDRLTIEFEGAITGYSVSYVPQVLEDGVGDPVPVQGVAFIQIVLVNVPDEPLAPQGTVTPALPGIAEVVGAGAGADETAYYGVGTNEAAGFRVLLVSNPNRLLVDVAHPGTRATTPPVDPSATADPTATTTSTPPELTLSADALADPPASPNEWLIYPVGGVAAVAVIGGLIGWRLHRRAKR